MKQNLLIQILACILAVFSALYIRYRKQSEVIETMNSYPAYISNHSANMTFSDLAEKIIFGEALWEE